MENKTSEYFADFLRNGFLAVITACGSGWLLSPGYREQWAGAAMALAWAFTEASSVSEGLQVYRDSRNALQ